MSVVDLAQFMEDLATQSGAAILPFFRSSFGLEDKGRGGPFDPVTEADRAGEAAMRQLIRRAFPSHGIVGEEFGPDREDAEYVDRFLAALDDLIDTGVCRAPGVAVDGGDGVSVALRERGRTIATVGVIGSRAEILARKDELASACLEHATSWGLR